MGNGGKVWILNCMTKKKNSQYASQRIIVQKLFVGLSLKG
jgi:hypothetical protein